MSRAAYFQKPESALQRSKDFISVGKENDALRALHDIIKIDRRHKQWSQTYEQIMFMYVELCVSLKNSNLAKDGLYQYKILTQQVATKSLEDVLEKYLSMAEARTQEAQKHSIERIEEIDDLDAADAPERLLLSVVSGALAQDRMDRTVLSPWLRFLWDSYRNSLDLLRNNTLFEQLYHHIAKQSFAFCLKYQRRSEFRKLCEILRLHLGQIQKSQANYAVKLTNIDSLTLMMETRLVQLDTAIAMELWQEAFKSAEDLHNIMQLTKDKDKKIVKPTSIVNYYDKISLVFWKGNNTLFHSAALLQKFNIYKDMKKTFTGEEALDQATRVLLSTLSIPDGADNPSVLTKHLDVEELHHANTRILSALLRLPISPNRIIILKEIARLNIPELAYPCAFNLYKCIELEFNPLRIASSVQEYLDKIVALNRPDYSQYVENIKAAVTLKIFKQLSSVYDSLSFKRLEKIIPFYNSNELEQFLVEYSKSHSLKAQVDHKSMSVYFCRTEAALSGDVENDSQRLSTNSESIQSHLELLYSKLYDLFMHLDKSTNSQLLGQLKKQIKIYNQTKDHDYDHILMRRKKIESYKENTETLKQEKLQQEKEMQSKLEEKRKEEERKRIEKINKENEVKRREAEKEDIQRKLRLEKIKKFQSNPMVQQIIKERGEELFETMDVDEVLKEQRLRMDADRKEQQQRLQQQEKKFDHTVRAFHLEEMAIRSGISEERQRLAPSLFEEYETNRIAKAIEDHNNSFLAYDRFQLAKSNAFEYIAGIITTNSTEFDAEYKTWEANFEQAREQVTIELKAERERKRQQRIQAEQKELEEQKRQNEVQQQRLLAEQSRAEKRPIQIERRPQSDRPRQPMRDEQTQRNPPRNTEIEFSRAEMRQRDSAERTGAPKRSIPAGRQQQQLETNNEISRANMRPAAKQSLPQQTPPPSQSSSTAGQQQQQAGPPKSDQQAQKAAYVPPHLRH